MMAEIYYPMGSGAGSGVDQAKWSDMARLWRTTGVEADEANELLVFGDSSGMQVKLPTGTAWIEGEYYENTTEKTLAVTTADGSNPRIDIVVIEVDWVTRVVAAKVIAGTPAATPSPEAPIQTSSTWQLKLAEILVGTGVSGITAGDVSDYREFSRAKMDGWIPANETWTFLSFSDGDGESTAVFTVPTDATEKYTPGMRIRFKQPTDGIKYGIVTAVSATTLTVFINTDYDLDNEEVIRPHYSVAKLPFGFDADPIKWQVLLEDSTNRSQATPTINTWYNPGGVNLVVPIGAWNIEWSAYLALNDTASADVSGDAGASTSASSMSSTRNKATLGFTYDRVSGTTRVEAVIGRQFHVVLAVATPYYMVVRATVTGLTTIRLDGSTSRTILQATLAYL